MLIYNYKLNFVIFVFLIQIIKVFGDDLRGYRTVTTHSGHLKTFYLDENDASLYVGGLDWIYKFDSKNIRNPREEFQLKTNIQRAGPDNLKYHNHIKVIHPLENHLFVCGTNGGQPQDWILIKNLNYTNGKNHRKTNSCGSDYEKSVTSVIVKNDDENMQLYSAITDFETGFGSIILSNLLITKNTQSVKGQLPEYSKFRSPTTFIGSFVIGNEVLFFFTEPVYEKNNQEFLISGDTFKKHSQEYKMTIFSRVARICKEDSGINGTNWSTFIRARLACSSTIENELVHFNKLKSIYPIPNNDKYFYALFTKNSNEKPFGYSAICKFSKFEIEQAFNSSFKERIDDTNQSKDKIRKPNSCGKNLQYNQSSTNDYSLVESVINATSILGFTSDDFETLVVDIPNKLPGFENISCTVYYVTSNNLVHKIIEKFNKTNNKTVIEESDAIELPTKIDAMKISSKLSFLYLSSNENIIQVNLKNCILFMIKHYHDKCMFDPYCGWNNQTCSIQIKKPEKNILTDREPHKVLE